MRVMAFGTFDRLHPGHLNYFKQAQGLGDELIIIVARDANVKRFKGRLPQENELDRLRHLRRVLASESGNFKVILGAKKNIWLVLKKYQPDIIALGYDQKINRLALKNELEKIKFSGKIKRLKAYYPKKYKSSLRRLNN